MFRSFHEVAHPIPAEEFATLMSSFEIPPSDNIGKDKCFWIRAGVFDWVAYLCVRDIFVCVVF
jgi:hypothetical protein